MNETTRPARCASLRAPVAFATVCVAGAAVCSTASPLAAQEVTYTRDVAPIVRERCERCHMEGSIAPIPLVDYDRVRHHSRLIREVVAGRTMPPWHIDRTVGIRAFDDDLGLTEEERETILAWADGGTPFGDRAELQEPADFADLDRFGLADRLGDPDLVIRSEPYAPGRMTRDGWFRTAAATGVGEPRWIRAMEIRPLGSETRRVVRHARVFLQQEAEDGERGVGPVVSSARGGSMGGPGLLMEWVLGGGREVLPDGAGKLMLPGAQLLWELYVPETGDAGRDEEPNAVGPEEVEPAEGAPDANGAEGAALELGLWFYPADAPPRNRTRLRRFDARGPTGLDIPPGEVAVTQQYHTLRWPTRLESFRPHMHRRGSAMQVEAVHPDGRTELLSRVGDFRWSWHLRYDYADHVAPLLPANTTLIVTAWHDNTVDNPDNPDPAQWVGWGDRMVDEMAHAWIDVTYLTQEEFDAEVEARRLGRDGVGAGPGG